MDRLDRLENQSIYLLREVRARYVRVGLCWSIGKDSTVLVYLARKAFFGAVPWPVIHLDTTFKFPEIYAFRDRLAAAWGLNLIVARNQPAVDAGMDCRRGFDCCAALKTEALRQVIVAGGFEALCLGIRRDEHGIRAKERAVSPRDGDFRWDPAGQPMELWDQHLRDVPAGTHHRIHPLLGWTELDVWQYVAREGLPVVDLYFAKAGRRYRSIGCQCCCTPVESQADTVEKIVAELKAATTAERAGRATGKEADDVMQKLRALGYM